MDAALQLAEQYGITTWIRALLDPAPVEKVAADAKKQISAPPPFHPLTDNPLFTQSTTAPAPTGGRGRGRLRSSSPGRSPAKKAVSPRKGRTTKASAAAAAAAAAALDHLPPDVHLEAPSDGAGDKHGLPPLDEETIHVDVNTAHQTNGDVDSSYTNVRVELPPKMSDMKEPESPEEMIARAKEMVSTAERLAGGGSGTTKTIRKRKADQIEVDDDDEDEQVNGITRPSKKTKTLQHQLRQEKIKARAWTGLSLTLAIGCVSILFLKTNSRNSKSFKKKLMCVIMQYHPCECVVISKFSLREKRRENFRGEMPPTMAIFTSFSFAFPSCTSSL